MDIITRTPGNPIFEAVHFSSWTKAKADLEQYDFQSEVVVSDLSQGAWKGHWISYELQLQLGLTGNELVQPVLDSGNYADIVGKLIDNESEGDRNFGLSLNACKAIRRRFRESGIKLLLVIPPKAGYQWEQENLEFLKLMHDALLHTDARIILLNFPNANIPENWTLEYLNKPEASGPREPMIPFFPGIVEASTAAAFRLDPAGALTLRSGFVAIDPTLRSEGWNRVDLVYLCYEKDYLAPAFQLRFGSEITPGSIEKQALLRFAEGGYGIALRLLSQLLPKLGNVLERESVRIQMQNIRIALLNFKDAANEEINTDGLPDMLKASLHQGKAWGLVMHNRPLEAEPHFEKARQYLNEKESPRLYLYLLNISALNKLRMGETETAFSYEKRIEATLDTLPERDWHVTYINYINQARLYKKIKDYDQAEVYYDKAFSINLQLKNESDLLYTNLCYAQLEELKGNEAKAFFFYLRTCIHWLSNDLPEALAPRVAQAILAKNLSGTKGEVEEISRKLRSSLESLSEKLGIKPDMEAAPDFNFIRSQHMPEMPKVALGQMGWGVCLSDMKINPGFNGPEYNRLKAEVIGYFRLFFPDVNWDDFHTIVTDTQFSCELPSTVAETLLVAWRLKIPNIVIKDQAFSFTDKDMTDLNAKIKVGISPAIDFVAYENSKMKVYFKRYKSAILLDETETRLMEQLQEKQNWVLNDLGKEEKIRNLEEKRLVQLYC